MKIKKGDTVRVLSGKDRGKIGKVLSVLKGRGRVVVEKVNKVKKHKKQSGDQKDPGGIVEVEAPIDVSKVMVVCPSCSKPTRVGYKVTKDKKVRICKKCKGLLD